MSETPICRVTVFGEVRIHLDEKPNTVLKPQQVTMLACLGIYAAAYPQKKLTRKIFCEMLWPDERFDMIIGRYRVACNRLNEVLGCCGAQPILTDNKQRTICLDPLAVKVDAVEFRAAYDAAQKAQNTFEKVEILYQAVALSEENLAGGEIRDQDFVHARRVLLEMQGDARYQLAICLEETGETHEALKFAQQVLPLHADKAQKLIDQLQQALVTSPKTTTHISVGFPPYLTKVVGQEDCLASIQKELRTHAIVTLIGPPGVGKTRLACEVAKHTATEFPNGAYFVELKGLTDTSLIAPTIAKMFGVIQTQELDILVPLSTRIGLQHILLVMDNCEHMIAACARTIRKIASQCANLRILVTSRQRTGLPGESVINVPLLEFSDNSKNSSAVRLFLERAMDANKDILPDKVPQTEQNEILQLVGDICRHLDGIPGAIEMAAAQAGEMTIEQIAEGIANRFQLLIRPDTPDEHEYQTFRQCIDWSYNLLTMSERELFNNLAVFVNGWTPDALKYICSGLNIDSDQLLEVLRSLVKKSMVVLRHAGRYDFLETTRVYALDKLKESGGLLARQQAHAGYFMKLAEYEEQHFYSPEQKKSLNTFEREWDNIRAALDFVLQGDDGEKILCFIYALLRFWWTFGYFTEGRNYTDTAREHPATQYASKSRVRVLNGAGVLFEMQGEYEKSTTLLKQAITLSEQLEPPFIRGISSAKANLGEIARIRGDYANSQRLLEEALSLIDQRGDSHSENMWSRLLMLEGLAHIAYDSGEFNKAEDFLLRAETIMETTTYDTRKTKIYTLFGQVYEATSRSDKAKERYQRALNEKHNRGKRPVAYALVCFGRLLIGEGEFDEARGMLTEALTICQKLIYLECLALAMETLGSLIVVQQASKTGLMQATSLYGAVAGLRQSTGLAASPGQKRLHEAYITELRQRLGKDFQHFWDEGSKLIWQDAVALALRVSE